jgi:FkbM family methyltransferase
MDYPEHGMSSPPQGPVTLEQQLLAWLRRISLNLEEFSNLQRISLLGEERVFDFLWQDHPIRFFLPNAASDLIQRHILKTSSFFEIELLTRFRRYVPKGAIVVDAGANIGNHTVYFAKICGAQKIHAFEPLHETFRILARNSDLNAAEQVVCYNLALGAGFGRADIAQYFGNNMGATQLGARVDGRYEVRPLDSFDLERIDVVKIDVEGAEVAVLDGARQSLARCKPAILIEILPEAGLRPHEFLVSLGYERAEVLGQRDFVYLPKVQ